MEEKMNELHSKMAAVLHIPTPKEIKIADKDHVQRLVKAEAGEDERINALLGDPNAYPEWLASTAELEWDELTDEQKLFFENYRAYVEEQHKTLAVKPRQLNMEGIRSRLALIDEATGMAEGAEKNLEAKKVIHFMSYDKHGSKGPGVYCSCGMFKLHRRGKVLAAWADKHYEKYGHYWKRT